jgi:hypothetical protein
MRQDELRRAATCCDELWIAYIAVKNMFFNVTMLQMYRLNIMSSRYMTWNVNVYILKHDEMWRAVTSFEFCITAKNICSITDVMNEIICHHIIHDLKRGWVHSCSMTSWNEPWRAVTSFEFRILRWKICFITDIMIEFFVVTHYMTLYLDVFIRAAWRAATCCDELFILYYDEKYVL